MSLFEFINSESETDIFDYLRIILKLIFTTPF
jgi:hypothetical protein